MRHSPLVSLAGLLLSVGCQSSGPERPAALAVGYVGPATLNLRKEIPLDAPVVATVKHGEKLEVIRRRRVFLQVRTAKGQVGWTNERLLLSAREMADLQRLFEQAKRLPPQGAASTYDLLNVHTNPARLSPSFLQVKPGEKIEVLLHRVTPRTAPPRAPLIPPAPKRVKKAARKAPEPKYPPPPLPRPPAPPANWEQLSKTPAGLVPSVMKAAPSPRRFRSTIGPSSAPRAARPAGRSAAASTWLSPMRWHNTPRGTASPPTSPWPTSRTKARCAMPGCGPPSARACNPTTSTASGCLSGACAATATRPPSSRAM